MVLFRLYSAITFPRHFFVKFSLTKFKWKSTNNKCYVVREKSQISTNTIDGLLKRSQGILTYYVGGSITRLTLVPSTSRVFPRFLKKIGNLKNTFMRYSSIQLLTRFSRQPFSRQFSRQPSKFFETSDLQFLDVKIPSRHPFSRHPYSRQTALIKIFGKLFAPSKLWSATITTHSFSHLFFHAIILFSTHLR